MLRLSETHSEKRGVLWLASYPVHCDWPNTICYVTNMLRPLPYCDAVSRRDDTKTINPIINEAFVASSGDIIIDYNDLCCLFTCPCLHLWSEKRQTISTTLHCSKLAFESSVANSLNVKSTYRLWVRSIRLSLQSWNCPTLKKQPLCKPVL